MYRAALQCGSPQLVQLIQLILDDILSEEIEDHGISDANWMPLPFKKFLETLSSVRDADSDERTMMNSAITSCKKDLYHYCRLFEKHALEVVLETALSAIKREQLREAANVVSLFPLLQPLVAVLGWDILKGKTALRRKLMQLFWTRKSQALRLQEYSHYRRQTDEALMSMEVLHDTTGKREVVMSYMNTTNVIEEDFGGCFFDDDADLAQVLQDQEIAYQLIQGNDDSGSSRTHLDPSSSRGHRQTLDIQKASGVANCESQLAVDEALARELQQIEYQLDNTSVDDKNITKGRKPETSTSNGGHISASRSPQVVMEDGIDPDNMTYEELQQLGEAIGTESKGLPGDVIALLPYSTYKVGIFSRKEKHEECAICCMAYKNRDKVTKLPCEHQYHQACVAKWLMINKVCPVCNKEVFHLMG